MNRNYKIVFVGKERTGKTKYVDYLMNDMDHTTKYIATIGVEVHPWVHPCQAGDVGVHIWDTAGDDRFGGLRDGYWIGADGFVIFGGSVDKYSFHPIISNTPYVLYSECGVSSMSTLLSVIASQQE